MGGEERRPPAGATPLSSSNSVAAGTANPIGQNWRRLVIALCLQLLPTVYQTINPADLFEKEDDNKFHDLMPTDESRINSIAFESFRFY